MGTAASREGRLDSDSEDDDGLDSPQSPSSSERSYNDSEVGTPAPPPRREPTGFSTPDPTILMKLGSLTLDGPPATGMKKAKLYHYIQGKWLVTAKNVGWQFVRDEGDEEDGDEDEEWRSSTVGHRNYKFWMLEVGGVRARVDDQLQMRFSGEQLRVDFVAKGVWALKFPSKDQFRACSTEYEDAKFENTYFLKPTEANKVKVFGKEFMGWAQGMEEDDSVWQDAEEVIPTPSKYKELRETLKTPSKTNIQSFAMGGLDHSFLVNDYGLDVLSNRTNGLEGTGITIRFQDEGRPPSSLGSNVFRTPKKGMLIRGESNMMLISPAKDGKSTAGGVSQLDIGTGKMVAEWRFEKDGTPITMRDVTNDSKGAQLYGGGSTFLGLDDNRLCRWDMRDSQGIVQQLASPAALTWTEGHQFSKGTNFTCLATAGNGSIVVGSKDGKVRLYGTTSMRMAKTAFPSLGSPITHVDVTYDGKWVLATTDTYLILISTAYRDKDGKMKTGFSGRMGGQVFAPRLLKLLPVDANRDGKQQKLHGGKFSWVTEEGKQERHLVVSAGNFTVVWDFDIVKDKQHDCYRGVTGLKSCYCYEVVAKPDNIVQSSFMHEKFLDDSGETPLVVATRQELSSFNL